MPVQKGHFEKILGKREAAFKSGGDHGYSKDPKVHHADRESAQETIRRNTKEDELRKKRQEDHASGAGVAEGGVGGVGGVGGAGGAGGAGAACAAELDKLKEQHQALASVAGKMFEAGTAAEKLIEYLYKDREQIKAEVITIVNSFTTEREKAAAWLHTWEQKYQNDNETLRKEYVQQTDMQATFKQYRENEAANKHTYVVGSKDTKIETLQRDFDACTAEKNACNTELENFRNGEMWGFQTSDVAKGLGLGGAVITGLLGAHHQMNNKKHTEG